MSPEADAQGALGTEARCATHGEARAEGVCSRCGTFLCTACGVPFEREVLCWACFDRNARQPEASSRAWASLYLGLAGLTCGFLPGLVGLVFAYYELDRIACGEASPGGRALARAGQLLGWLNAALLAVVSLVLLSRLSGGADAPGWHLDPRLARAPRL